MKKYLFLLKNSFLTYLEYRFEIVTHLTMEALGLLFTFFLWKTIIDESGSVGGYDFDGIIAYYVLQRVFWSLNANKVVKTLEKMIREGRLSFILLKPSSTILNIFSNEISKVLFNFFLSMLVFLPVFIFYREAGTNLIVNWYTIVWTLLFLVLSLIFNYIFCFAFGCLAFWLTSLGGLRNTVYQFIGILRGAWFPLDIAPMWFQKFTAVLPFSYLTFYPVKILTSKTTTGDNLKAVGILIIYSCIFGWVTRVLWKKGLIQYSSVGG